MIGVTDRPEPGVILTHRPHDMRQHAGQVAFPGGKLDPGEDAVTAALRETHEELGINPSHISDYRCDRPLRHRHRLRHHPGDGADAGRICRSFPIRPKSRTGSRRRCASSSTPRTACASRPSIAARLREYTEIVWEGHVIWGVTAAIIENLSAAARVGGAGRWLRPCRPPRWTKREDLAKLRRWLRGPWGRTRRAGSAARCATRLLGERSIRRCRLRHAAEAAGRDGQARTRRDQGDPHRDRARHRHRAAARRQGRDHHIAPRRLDRRPPRHDRICDPLGRGRRPARLHHQRALCRSAQRSRSSTISAGSRT